MSFNEKYKKIKKLAESELSVIEKKMVSSIIVREPLNSHLVKFLTAPSKRVRPVLAVLYTKACEYSCDAAVDGQNGVLSDKQLELLAAIELVHNASLIHDDIIDESKLRRGEKTVSENFGNKLGVISGDYILSVAMEKLSHIGSVDIIKKFSQTLKQMCIGEINQNFDRFKIGTIEDYIEKSKNKTGYLFEAALSCTAMLSDFPYNMQEISEFALNVGIAFQIRDDLLNLTQADSTKPSNNDISEGIYNAPVIYSQNTEGYSEGIEKTGDLLNNYIQNAMVQVKNLPDNVYKNALKEFLELINNE